MRLLYLSIILLFSFPLIINSQVESLSDINSEYYSVYCPSISFDGKTMIFESNASGKWRLYESNRMGEKRWSNPRYLFEINNTINKKFFVGGCFQSYDGKYLLFTSDGNDGFGDMDILISEKRNGKWGKPKNIGAPINSINFEGFPSLSPDGTELFFMRNFVQGEEPKSNRYYLYKSKKKINGEWGEPQLLPSEINKYNCECPRILSNGESLLFASKRPDSRGGFDIYQVESLGVGGWSKPQNMVSINSIADENTFTVDGSGKYIYFARSINGLDQIFVSLIQEKEEQIYTLKLNCKIFDSESKKSILSEIKLIDTETKDILYQSIISDMKSEYSIYLERGKNITIEVNSKGYSFWSETIYLKSPELNLEETDGSRLQLNQIFDQLIMNKDDEKIISEAFEITNEANKIMVEDKRANDDKIKDLTSSSLKTGDIKLMKKQLSEIEDLKITNHKLVNEAIVKFRIANNSFLNILNKYIDNYKVTSDKNIALLGENLEQEAKEFWEQSKSERLNADNARTNIIALKTHTSAKELESKAIRKLLLSFEYYLQYLNFNKNLIEKDISLIPLKKNISIVLRNITFDFDKDIIKESSYPELDKLIDLLNSNKAIKVELSAHTDDKGSDDYNLKLSERRARSVANYLIKNGIYEERLTAIGYGEQKPLVPNDTEENMEKNRRVEFKIK